jgi:hypothetical protein
MHTVMVDGQPLAVKLPAKGAGIFVVNGRELEGALVKGINDYDDSSVAPSVRWFNSIIQADTDSDISFVNKELTQWQYS